MTNLQTQMERMLPDVELRFDEPMHKHTSLRIGGGAEVMAFPKNRDELSKILKVSALLDTRPAILGAGTNILAPDQGIPGVVVCLKDSLDGMEQLDETRIRVLSGVTMTRAAVFAAKLGLSGLEFAHGIPGSLGGAATMNAGAYGGEMCQVVREVRCLNQLGERETVTDFDYGYRHSVFSDGSRLLMAVKLGLQPGKPEEIRARMAELSAKRQSKQPLEYPSAGSVFKRPEGRFAGALVESCGLKGLTVGGAQVSPKHAGFIINVGGATCADVLELVRQIQEKVRTETGVELEMEVKILDDGQN